MRCLRISNGLVVSPLPVGEVVLPEAERVRAGLCALSATNSSPVQSSTGRDYLSTSPKNSRIAAHDFRSATSLYAAPFDLSVPAIGWVKEWTASA